MPRRDGRILLVEDVRSTRTALREVLENEGLYVMEAASRDEALAAIRRIAFHAVCIDLGLDENDPTNVHGRDVLREIARRAEGTRTIIVSQHEIHHITVEAFEKFALDRYFRKGQFKIRELADAVRSEASSATLKIFGEYSSAFDALLHEVEEELWVHQALQVLSPKGGYSTLRRAVDGMVGRLTPLRPHSSRELRAVVESEENSVHFFFWSRALGQAVKCYVLKGRTKSSGREVLEDFSFDGLRGEIVPEATGEVADFID